MSRDYDCLIQTSVKLALSIKKVIVAHSITRRLHASSKNVINKRILGEPISR